MATALLIIIYIAFIGLGIPDSLFGTAWPAIYSEFELPISFGSFVTIIVSCGTVLSSVISSKIISRFGTNKVSAYSTLLTALALLGFSFAPNLWVMCFLAIILGVGAGAIDVALNNYVALHYSATHMSFLHCFYGVGVSVSPYILSLVIAGKFGWRGGYRIAFAIQLVITLLLFLSIPLWHKVHGDEIFTDNRKEIDRLKAVIDRIQNNPETVFKSWEFIGGESVVNLANNRLQLNFEKKPSDERIEVLKKNGFKWAPTHKSWQRPLTHQTMATCDKIDFIKPKDGRKPTDIQPKAPKKNEPER